MKDFTTLKVWEKSHEIALEIYKLTKEFPKEELYGLTSQIRRASTSIPANIAEGCGCSSDADLIRFLHISMGSANELQYFLILGRDLGYIAPEIQAHLQDELIRTKKMLNTFIQSLKARG